MLDRERVDGRREEPVDEQEADDRGGERGPDAADGRDHDDEQQEQQQDARQPEVGRGGSSSTQVSSGRPTAREHEAEQHPPPRERARAARPWTSSARVPSSARLITWTSSPTPESRITRLITEPRVSSANRERRVAPSTIWVAFSVRAAATSASPTSAPTTSRYVPPSSSTSSRWRSSAVGGAAGEPVLRPHVDGDEVALRRAPPSAPRGGRGARRRRSR